jgi:hypothetical protein
MRAAEILELPEVSFLEPCFSDLTGDMYTEALLGIPATGGRLLLDPAEDPLAVAVTDGKEWYATSFLYRRPPREVIELCERLECDMYEEERAAWEAAVREYYSLLLMGTTTPAMEDLPPDRTGRLQALLGETWGQATGGEGPVTCLDCCCGSGAGSAAARALGMRPLSYDNDPALLSLGLSAGRLLPEETMWIDAARAGEYLGRVPRGVAVMMGEINNFTAEMWEGITAELVSLADDVIITVGTEAEARRVEEWCRASGRRDTLLSENRRDLFYDRWVCRSKRD